MTEAGKGFKTEPLHCTEVKHVDWEGLTCAVAAAYEHEHFFENDHLVLVATDWADLGLGCLGVLG